MPDSLPTIITLIIALSVAAERVVEIIKSVFYRLDQARPDPRHEGYRRAGLHGLAIVAGFAISYFAWPIVAQVLATTPAQAARPVHLPTVAALGLLASGGSGFWNSILTYALSMKQLRRAEVGERTARNAMPDPLEGELQP